MKKCKSILEYKGIEANPNMGNVYTPNRNKKVENIFMGTNTLEYSSYSERKSNRERIARNKLINSIFGL